MGAECDLDGVKVLKGPEKLGSNLWLPAEQDFVVDVLSCTKN